MRFPGLFLWAITQQSQFCFFSDLYTMTCLKLQIADWRQESQGSAMGCGNLKAGHLCSFLFIPALSGKVNIDQFIYSGQPQEGAQKAPPQNIL